MTQKIFIENLLKEQNGMKKLTIEANEQLELDFSNIKEIRLPDIQKLLALHKLAIFNGLHLQVAHIAPQIQLLLEQTGLYKTLNTMNLNTNRNIKKRVVLD